MDTRNVAISKLKESDHLARQVRPVRMVVIAGSFPYKEQLEEFKNKLGLATLDDVRLEKSKEKDDEGNYLPSLRFLEVVLERKEIDAEGRTVRVRDKDNKLVEWKPIDLERDYEPYLILTGMSFEEEDAKYEQVSFTGLYMPRLKLFREDEDTSSRMGIAPPMGADPEPPAARDPAKGYPKVEEKLKNLMGTLKALEGKPPEAVKAPSRFDPKGFRVFGGKPAVREEKKEKEEVKESAEAVVPDYCLVRLIDVTAQPGKTYVYRMKVKMANPNYGLRANQGEKGVADLRYARDEYLESDWSKDIKVEVEPEMHFYLVDEREVKRAEGKDKLAAYKGPFWREPVRPGQVILRVHRWLEAVTTTTTKRAPLPVGEWTVAERMPVYRGEYVGRRMQVELPYWRYARESFVMASEYAPKGRKTPPGIPVDFGLNRGSPMPEALLVDFTPMYGHFHARPTEKAKTTGVSDVCAGEALLLSPSGELLLLEGVEDVKSEERIKRLQAVHDRIEEVKKGKKDGKQPKKPFP
jgi:hypothetical protein